MSAECEKCGGDLVGFLETFVCPSCSHRTKNDPITPQMFTPVPITGKGELRLSNGPQTLEITEDWQMRLAIGAAGVINDEFGDLEPDPIVGIPAGARFVRRRAALRDHYNTQVKGPK